MNETDVIVDDGVAGTGVIADMSFSTGDLILPITGKLVEHATRYTIQIDHEKHVELAAKDPAIKLNHHCEANARFDLEQEALIAQRPIEEGEEIYFNYLTSEFDLSHPFTCQCKAPGCPGVIRGFKHLPLLQQQKLYLMLLPYLQEYVDSR